MFVILCWFTLFKGVFNALSDLFVLLNFCCLLLKIFTYQLDIPSYNFFLRVPKGLEKISPLLQPYVQVLFLGQYFILNKLIKQTTKEITINFCPCQLGHRVTDGKYAKNRRKLICFNFDNFVSPLHSEQFLCKLIFMVLILVFAFNERFGNLQHNIN